SGVATVVMARYARRLPGPSARPWWALVLAGALLAVGQSIAALPGAAGGPAQAGWADVPQLLAVVPAVAACLLLLPPRSGGRLGLRVLLDGLVVLVAVGVLAGLVLSDAVLRTDGPAGALVTVGYPAAGSVLCGVALVTVIRVPDVRRRAAAWLLVAAPVAWAGMLAAALRAADSDPGRPAEEPERPAGLPLLGFVVGSSVASGVALVVLVAFLAGRPVPATVCVGTALLVLLVFARTLLWAADSGRMTRRLLRTEAYLRALVSSAEDVTVVLDGIGTVTWVSGAVRTQLGWTDAELTGRSLPELVHPDDRDVLARVSAATGGSVATGLAETVRLGTREGDWRDVEISGVARAGVP
ncbi:MAG: PAS domain S-box protein, partial [Geodermatophilales bacterium]|nr:PAS domain S-box protein [Geodermatophilales bacterium]